MISPWGEVQHKESIAPGILFVETASHGGILLGSDLHAKMRPEWRTPDQWYEEDCEYCRVVLTFPQYFPEHIITASRMMLENHPEYFVGSIRGGR